MNQMIQSIVEANWNVRIQSFGLLISLTLYVLNTHWIKSLTNHLIISFVSNILESTNKKPYQTCEYLQNKDE